MRDSSPQPRLIYRGGSIYIDTHVGVLARLDADSGDLDWGYGYKTDPLQGQNRFFFYDTSPRNRRPPAVTPLQPGEAFLVKGMQSGRLYAIDPNRMKVLWERPITKSSRLLGVNDTRSSLVVPRSAPWICSTRQLLWATRLPNGSMEGRVLVRPDGIWQLTPRGIFEIDPKSGRYGGSSAARTWAPWGRPVL